MLDSRISGLSPRVRGRVHVVGLLPKIRGAIPARAGERANKFLFCGVLDFLCPQISLLPIVSDVWRVALKPLFQSPHYIYA